MRAVIDTNIFLAGLLNADGGAAKIIRAFQDGEFELVVTHDVFDEYVRVIHLFDNDVPPHKSEELLELVFAKATKVRPAAAQGLARMLMTKSSSPRHQVAMRILSSQRTRSIFRKTP